MDIPSPPPCIDTYQFDLRVQQKIEKLEKLEAILPFEESLLFGGEMSKKEPEPLVVYINRRPYTCSATEADSSAHEMDNEELRAEITTVIYKHRKAYGYKELEDYHVFTFCYDSHRPISVYGELMSYIDHIVKKSQLYESGLAIVLANWDSLTSHKESYVKLFEPYAGENDKHKIVLHVCSNDPNRFYTVDALEACRVLSPIFPDTFEDASDNVQVFIECLRVWFMQGLMRDYPNIEDVRAQTEVATFPSKENKYADYLLIAH
ncbi:hypothetical protein N7470_003938 [Penicillium chermesinum]|nr:hypothetical protein N7470_003938 [Penicillium chermesinum]